MKVKSKMDIIGISEITSKITYKPGWSIALHVEGVFGNGDRPYIQVVVDETAEAALCPFSGKREGWKGGKKYLSYHMCRQEIVGAVLGAFKDAEMHEIHEWFKYKGRAIYNPHLDPDALAEFAVLRNMNVRQNAMSMVE